MKARYIIIIALQVLVLAGMIGYRTYWIATGERVILRTVPVDPRDIFRGDYVRLNYTISNLDCKSLIISETFKRHEPIYVLLKKGPEDFWEPFKAQKIKPDAMPFIQGRVLSDTNVTHYRVTVRDEQGTMHDLSVPWVSEDDMGKAYTFCLDEFDNMAMIQRWQSNNGCSSMRSIIGTISDIRKDYPREIRVEYGIDSYFVEEGQGLILEKARNARNLKVEIALNSKGQGTITALILGAKRIED